VSASVPAVSARNRAWLEQLCRYALRPAVGQNRLQWLPDGTVVLELRRRWVDGTTHLVFDPVELLERLAALVPRPRINLVLYYGVFAPRAAGRRGIVPGGDGGAREARRELARRPANPTWAQLMQRSFRLREGSGGLAEALRAKAVGFDVLACPRCAGRLRLMALIHHPDVVRRILTHLGQSPDALAFHPSRDPPETVWLDPP
jgi:hypothetical protein